jgi:type IV fimbrial biogenesis protein FimT
VLKGGVTREPGFTLIEVIVALAIFAILVALAVPSMNTWIANVKVRSAADALQNGLRMAQAESLRRSRQIVFSLTNSPTPNQALTAAPNGNYWSINTIPSMTDGSELSQFIESGTLTTTTSGVQITGPAEICFNSMGRLVANNATGIAGGTCLLGVAPSYQIALPAADRPLQVSVSLGGQVHMCDIHKTLSVANPDGC